MSDEPIDLAKVRNKRLPRMDFFDLPEEDEPSDWVCQVIDRTGRGRWAHRADIWARGRRDHLGASVGVCGRLTLVAEVLESQEGRRRDDLALDTGRFLPTSSAGLRTRAR